MVPVNVIQALEGCAFSSIIQLFLHPCPDHPQMCGQQLRKHLKYLISDCCLSLEVNQLSDGNVLEGFSNASLPVTHLFSSRGKSVSGAEE